MDNEELFACPETCNDEQEELKEERYLDIDLPTRKRSLDDEDLMNQLSKQKSSRKQAWSREEDATLLELINSQGPSNWDQLAKSLVNRTGKQCRERYYNILDPKVKRGHWTVEEDRLIVELHNSIGKKWAEIAKQLGGRTDNSVKNRWHTLNNSVSTAQSKPSVEQIQLARSLAQSNKINSATQETRSEQRGDSSCSSEASATSIPL